MGSEAPDAAPNERPITPVTLSCYYLSRHPITNAHYELFDPSHAGKRATGDAIDSQRKPNGSTRRAERMAANIPGDGRSGGAIWRISLIATLTLPGVIVGSTMASQKAPQWERFRAAPVPSEWKTWRGMSGSGAATSWKPIAALPKSTREDRSRARNESIGVGAGSRASTACGRRRVAPMCQTTPATTSVSGLFASAICKRFVAGNAE